MPDLSDEQIFQALLAQYKNRGIDLHQVLGDPLFVGLPANAKIKLITQYAREIEQGTGGSWSKGEVKNVVRETLLDAVEGAGFAAAGNLAAAALFRGARPSLPIILGGAAVAGVYGAVSNLSKNREEVARRQRIKETLGVLAQKRDVPSALNTLSEANRHSGPNPYLNRVQALISGVHKPGTYRGFGHAMGIATNLDNGLEYIPPPVFEGPVKELQDSLRNLKSGIAPK